MSYSIRFSHSIFKNHTRNENIGKGQENEVEELWMSVATIGEEHEEEKGVEGERDNRNGCTEHAHDDESLNFRVEYLAVQRPEIWLFLVHSTKFLKFAIYNEIQT